MFFIAYVCVVWDYPTSNLKNEHDKKKTVPKKFKNAIKILAYPGFAWSGFEQPGLVV